MQNFENYLDAYKHDSMSKQQRDSLFLLINPCGKFSSAYADTFRVAIAKYLETMHPEKLADLDYDPVRVRELAPQ